MGGGWSEEARGVTNVTMRYSGSGSSSSGGGSGKSSSGIDDGSAVVDGSNGILECSIVVSYSDGS